MRKLQIRPKCQTKQVFGNFMKKIANQAKMHQSNQMGFQPLHMTITNQAKISNQTGFQQFHKKLQIRPKCTNQTKQIISNFTKKLQNRPKCINKKTDSQQFHEIIATGQSA